MMIFPMIPITNSAMIIVKMIVRYTSNQEDNMVVTGLERHLLFYTNFKNKLCEIVGTADQLLPIK